MMDKPNLSTERLEAWHKDDEMLSMLVKHIDKKMLNIEEWPFMFEGKKYTYHELTKNLQGALPDLRYLLVCKKHVFDLPNRLEIARSELLSVFKRFTLNYQERATHMENMQKYIDILKKENDELKGIVLKPLADLTPEEKKEIKEVTPKPEVPKKAEEKKEIKEVIPKPKVPKKVEEKKEGDDIEWQG